MSRLERLHDDLWLELSRWLEQRDLAALAVCSRATRKAARYAMERRDLLRVRHCLAEAATDACPGATGLDVRGLPRRYGQAAWQATPPLRLPALLNLRRLELHHPRLPSDAAFWPAVFEQCARLRHVVFIADFFLANYAVDVRHVADLVTHGAPRLETLDIEGSWLIIQRVWDETPQNAALAQVIKRVQEAPPVRSATLRRLRHFCRQVPLGVDSPLLTHLAVDDQSERPPLATRMGPATMAAVTDLAWRGYWPGFDAAAVAGMTALRHADISVLATTPYRLARCLRTLGCLPAGLRRLTLDLDTWPMGTGTSDIEWPSPLAHLEHLEHLEVSMRFPPDSVLALLAGWLGAGPSVRTAVLRFRDSSTRFIESEMRRLREEEEAATDDEGLMELADQWERVQRPAHAFGLSVWLDARPQATATIHNFPALRCPHPRCKPLL